MKKLSQPAKCAQEETDVDVENNPCRISARVLPIDEEGELKFKKGIRKLKQLRIRPGYAHQNPFQVKVYKRIHQLLGYLKWKVGVQAGWFTKSIKHVLFMNGVLILYC